jgi:Zn-dependent membrane protease YugP
MIFDPVLLGITILFMIIGGIVSSVLQAKFRRYSSVPNDVGLTGKEIAEQMLRAHGLYDVRVISVPGHLTDHYNPTNKTVNLSPEVYHGRSVAAAAVAAHECGHAVQHAIGYSWLQLRSKLVPVVQFSQGLLQWIYLALFILGISAQMFDTALLLIIILQSAITLFSLITLPVEVDASRRALAWVQRSHVATGRGYAYAKDALKWAALTYFVAALASLAQLLYFILLFLSRRDD